jgi:hypothetical protein
MDLRCLCLVFPEEKYAYADSGKGGPYPEISFLLLAMIGFVVTILGWILARTA